MKHYNLKALSVGAGGGSWYSGSIVVRYQPWAARDARWYAEWKGFASTEHTRYAPDRKRLAAQVPFTFSLQRPKKQCKWFLHCGRPATGTIPHPVLGDVPTCDRCAAFAKGG